MIPHARLPVEAFPVQQDPHQLGDGDRRMGVVELDGDLVGQPSPVGVALAEPPEDVLESGRHEEVLLLEPQLLAHVLVVRRVEDLGDGLAAHLVLDRPHVLAGLEAREVELAGRLGRPQPQRVHGVVPVARRPACRRPWP